MPTPDAGPSEEDRPTLGDRLLVLAIFVIGCLPGLAGLFPHHGETEYYARVRLALLGVSVMMLAAVTGMLWLYLQRTRRRLAAMDELLDDFRFGQGTKRDREAVDILVRALRQEDPEVRETALRTLRKITGHDLGPDARRWEAWWTGARSAFTRATSAPAPGKK